MQEYRLHKNAYPLSGVDHHAGISPAKTCKSPFRGVGQHAGTVGQLAQESWVNMGRNLHMPMVAGFLGKNLRFYEIDKGIAGRTPNDKTPFLAIGYFYITDVAEYNKAIGQNIEAIVGDFKNYTSIQPVVQINEIKQVVHTSSQ